MLTPFFITCFLVTLHEEGLILLFADHQSNTIYLFSELRVSSSTKTLAPSDKSGLNYRLCSQPARPEQLQVLVLPVITTTSIEPSCPDSHSQSQLKRCSYAWTEIILVLLLLICSIISSSVSFRRRALTPRVIQTRITPPI